jgi:hypothetical protein
VTYYNWQVLTISIEEMTVSRLAPLLGPNMNTQNSASSLPLIVDQDENGTAKNDLNTARSKQPDPCIEQHPTSYAPFNHHQSTEPLSKQHEFADSAGAINTCSASECGGQGVDCISNQGDYQARFGVREDLCSSSCNDSIKDQQLKRLELELVSLRTIVLKQTVEQEAERADARIHRLTLQDALEAQNSTLRFILAAVSPAAVANESGIPTVAPCIASASPPPTLIPIKSKSHRRNQKQSEENDSEGHGVRTSDEPPESLPSKQPERIWTCPDLDELPGMSHES